MKTDERQVIYARGREAAELPRARETEIQTAESARGVQSRRTQTRVKPVGPSRSEWTPGHWRGGRVTCSQELSLVQGCANNGIGTK